MSVTAMIQAMLDVGVTLKIRGDKLRVDAPSGVMTSELRQSIRECKDEIIAALRSRNTSPLARGEQPNNDPLPPKREPKPYIYCCPACGGTNWGCIRLEVETLPGGQTREFEVWGCLDCSVNPVLATLGHPKEGDEKTCNDCHGDNLVFDQAGAYCADCRRRPLAKRS